MSTLGMSLLALMFIASTSAASSMTYKATCTGAVVVPPVTSKATGSVSITLINQTFASGYFYANNINQMTMVHLHSGAVGSNGPAIAWAFNGTYGPISGSIKASFTFNPSANNISALLAAGRVYFNIHTTAYPAGELRGQLHAPVPNSLTVAKPSNQRPPDLMKNLTNMRKDPETSFKLWAAAFNKSYADQKETAYRQSIWTSNLDYIISENSKNLSYWLNTNHLADLNASEYRGLLGFKHQKNATQVKPGPSASFLVNGSIPATIDWRRKNAVTPIKNQGQCGSCWTFSTTGAIEGITAISTGKLVSLSEQEIVSCSINQCTNAGGCNGCQGGTMNAAFTWILGNGGIDRTTEYPYLSGKVPIANYTCVKPLLNMSVTKIAGYVKVDMSEQALMAAVAQQPVSIAIEANGPSFLFYAGGIYSNSSCGINLDHGVLVVGYGIDPVEGYYWIVKNQWTTMWGDEGFIFMKFGEEMPYGLCGMYIAASYPVMKPVPNMDITADYYA